MMHSSDLLALNLTRLSNIKFAWDVGELLLCSTLLLVFVWALGVSFRTWSAAMRHRIWFLAFCGLALLPVSIHVFPPLKLPLLAGSLKPAVTQIHSSESVDNVRNKESTEQNKMPSTLVDQTVVDSSIPVANEGENDRTDIIRSRVFRSEEAFAAASTVPADIAQSQPSDHAIAAPNAKAERSRFGAWPIWLIVIWATGVVLSLLSLVGEWFSKRNCLQNTDATTPEWLQSLLAEQKRALSFSGNVRLLCSTASIMPMICGVIRPQIVLPVEAGKWSIERSRFVLLHELSHIQRRDVLIQIISRMVCSLYWFHPLAWMALDQLRFERELACDDRVVASGAKASDYAQELVHLARFHSRLQTFAVAVATSSNMEYRIQSLFNSDRSHRPVSQHRASVLLFCAVLAIVALSTVRIGFSERTDNESPRVTANQSPLATVETAVQDPAEFTVIRGRVFDSAHNPVVSARVFLMQTFTSSVTSTTSFEEDQNKLVAETRTDDQGNYQFSVSREIAEQFGERINRECILRAVAFKEESAIAWTNVYSSSRDFSCSFDLYLPALEQVVGRIVDQQHNPIANVRVRIHSLQTVSLDHWISKSTEESKTSYRPGSNGLSILNLQANGIPVLTQNAKTDADGRFTLAGLGRDRIVTLEIQAAGIAKSLITVMMRKHEPVPYREYDPRFTSSYCFGSEFEFVAVEEQKIFGVILDEQSGAPVPGVQVGLSAGGFASENRQTVVTDSAGTFVLAGIQRPGDETNRSPKLDLIPPADEPYFRHHTVSVSRNATSRAAPLKIELPRTRWLSGQLKDLESGESVAGKVAYFPFNSSSGKPPFARQTNQYALLDHGVATDSQGHFRIPVLPGLGMVAAIANEQQEYRRGICDREYLAPKDVFRDWGGDHTLYQIAHGNLINTAEIVDINAERSLGPIDIELIPIPTKTLVFRDTEGAPLTGVKTVGMYPQFGTMENEAMLTAVPSPSDSVTIRGLANYKRWILFYHPERCLGKAVLLGRDDRNEIILEPCAKVVGKINATFWTEQSRELPKVRTYVDVYPSTEARPAITSRYGFQKNYNHNPQQPRFSFRESNINPDGTFEIDTLLPGARYNFYLNNKLHPVKPKSEAMLLPVKPGQTIDMGMFDARFSYEEAKAKLKVKKAAGDFLN